MTLQRIKPVTEQPRVTQFFDEFAPSYFSRYDIRDQDGHSFRIRKQRVLEEFKKLPAGSTVLDVGCGPGVMVRELLDAGYRVIATDIALAMIEECRKQFPRNDRLELIVAPAEHLPLPAASVDGIMAMGLVEYLKDDAEVLREFARILKPQGLIAITLPHEASPSRLWDRLTKWLARPLVLLVRGLRGKVPTDVLHREYRLNEYHALCETSGIHLTHTVFYNMKVFLRPLDRLFPAAGVRCSESLERFARTPFLRRLGTGFIVFGKKK
ncbi:class I SAM-dependent methyltransferase [Candidatus Uhrbacteria bacterium]|nr:class I SAM-dependent methyltransferase [Candidatus Uhrbacteria bacterium]